MAAAKTMDYKQLKDWIKETRHFLPMEDYRFALISGLEEAVLHQTKEEGISDEKKYRLQWFGDFTCFQLEQLAQDNPHWFEEKAFLQTFLNRTQQRLVSFQAPPLEEDAFLAYHEEDVHLFFARFRPLFADYEDAFEGLPVDDAMDVLEKASTLKMLKDLALLHALKLPRRIHKDELIEIIQRRGSLSDEEAASLAEEPVLKIEQYANQHHINVHIELKKRDMIEYIYEKWTEQAYRMVALDAVEDASSTQTMVSPVLDLETRFEEIYRHYRRVKNRRRNRVFVGLVFVALVVTYLTIDFLNLLELPFQLF